MSALAKPHVERPLSTLPVRTGLDLPHLDADHKLERILNAALSKNAPPPPVDAQGGRHNSDLDDAHRRPAFAAGFFELHKTPLFADATETMQAEMLAGLSDAMLHEAYFIEKSGIAFGAKMILLAPTTEERQLYALFAADEARHLSAVGAHLPGAKTRRTDSPFHHLLSDLIEHGGRSTLVFVIQVVLEGWGLTHYRALAAACVRPTLQAVLRGILEDEARHHGSGKVITDTYGIDVAAREEIVETMTHFLEMVRVGPQNVFDTINKVHGGLTRAQTIKLYDDVDASSQIAQRLALLKRLMTTQASAPIIAALEKRGLFSPRPRSAGIEKARS